MGTLHITKHLSREKVLPDYNWTRRAKKNNPTSGRSDGSKPGKPTHQKPLIVSELKKPKPVDPANVPAVATPASASAHASVQTAPKAKQKKCTIV
jgi:hypothetical protein